MKPLLSIVMPALNEVAGIEATLQRATGMFAGTNYDDTYWERLSAAKASAK